MAYSASQTAATIINAVKNHFSAHDRFQNLAVFAPTQTYLDAINEVLEELYAECGWQQDEFSITTVVAQAEYPLDGTSGNLPKAEIDLIVRVDYDGTPLQYQYKYPDELIAPTASSAAGTPDGWYEKWDNDVRYLGLKPKPDAAKTLKVYSWRLPVVITATTGVPAVQFDFFSLIKKIIIRKFYVMMEDFERAVAYANVEGIAAQKKALREVNKRRRGRRLSQIVIQGPRDVFT